MLRVKESKFKDINFSILDETMTNALESSVKEYWGYDGFIGLQAVNEFKEYRNEKIIKGIDFFSSKINVHGHKPITIRLSKNFVETFLNSTLSSIPEEFSLSKLTSMEISILNSFSKYLYKKIKDILVPEDSLKVTEKSEDIVNIVFMVSISEGEISHIVVSLPSDRLKLEKLKKSVVFNDEFFYNSYSTVKIRVGHSKITLEDLESLSPEDIIVLDDSNLTKMTLISGDFKQDFKIKIDSSLIVENDEFDNNEDIYNEVTMEKNLWDDIQIEISAEFEKVKMTIGELKQISQGQIINLGSVFENEISLFVDDKKVAKGELIIINDKYAVRLNEVLSKDAKPEVQAKKSPEATQQKPAAKPAAPQPKPQKPEPKKAEDEEFDYSDFEK